MRHGGGGNSASRQPVPPGSSSAGRAPNLPRCQQRPNRLYSWHPAQVPPRHTMPVPTPAAMPAVMPAATLAPTPAAMCAPTSPAHRSHILGKDGQVAVYHVVHDLLPCMSAHADALKRDAEPAGCIGARAGRLLGLQTVPSADLAHVLTNPSRRLAACQIASHASKSEMMPLFMG